jgi:DNA-binding GntR family transcriptional regulator
VSLSPLQTRVIGEILAYARRENLPKGSHLSEPLLARVIGTSRSPIKSALSHLTKIGIARHQRNRGYFLAVPTSSLSLVTQKWMSATDDPIYLKIAENRLDGALPDTVSESFLSRRYGAPRNAIRRTLYRIQQEGWAERRTGHGWLFLPLINSPQAYEESYAFRLAIEPAGILSPSFAPDLRALEACRKQQEAIYGGGYQTMSAIELFEANARFHETIARWSHNRFIEQAVKRLNHLRRLVEYKQAKRRSPRQRHAEEHLAILDAVTQGDFLRAALKMRTHLEDARREKVVSEVFDGSRR